MEDGDDQTAMAHYVKLLTLAPDSDDAARWHNNLGILLARPGRLDEAATHYREALRLGQRAARGFDPALCSDEEGAHIMVVMYSAHLNLGNVFLERGQIDKAANEYAAAIRVQPSSAAAHTQLGIALSELGQLDRAIEMFQKALQLDPNDPAVGQKLDTALSQRRRAGASDRTTP
jgi:tetratricopeptide (TPR) repeat protein